MAHTTVKLLSRTVELDNGMATIIRRRVKALVPILTRVSARIYFSGELLGVDNLVAIRLSITMHATMCGDHCVHACVYECARACEFVCV